MPNLSIKDVPEAWAEALRKLAASHHRSLQGELMAIIEQAVKDAALLPPGDADKARGRIVGFDTRGWPIYRQGWKTPEQVVAELRAQHPKPVRGQPLAVDILRADRDSR
ncbi:MAG TPA: Arc family DNA-binding protein [Ramlibacter sp.]|uniref:FitA-like ribbon-helix-helix domain-containing protein n=1 Tax=Ramlibacter sp. TaxID=1917967 RepID=UPI002BF42B7F|nr:Arc family DNA-binding protein [Ramlibacter sp.]HVZ42724.1 Arc family DNA-binding protein [Ramlibacter sp.]